MTDEIKVGDIVRDPAGHVGKVEHITDQGRTIVTYRDESAWDIRVLKKVTLDD